MIRTCLFTCQSVVWCGVSLTRLVRRSALNHLHHKLASPVKNPSHGCHACTTCSVCACCVCCQVQAGAGRSGKWWAHQHFDNDGMKPDMVVFAKGIASGYPLAGTATHCWCDTSTGECHMVWLAVGCCSEGLQHAQTVAMYHTAGHEP